MLNSRVDEFIGFRKGPSIRVEHLELGCVAGLSLREFCGDFLKR